ncbi:MAG: MarR family transcriptional regulator [Eubacteriales bacterium]|jgi:MarR family transcriptional regulator for hemolysin|nr:MarR family transcriptional regulator [Eubacteriales bacterium]
MFDINEQLTYLVYVMQKRMRRQMSMALDRYDVTLEQFVVLYNLVNDDGINQKTLSRRVDKDQATLARILDILESRGYVERRTTEKDRRAFLVFITDKGKEKVKETSRRLASVHNDIVEGIPPENIDEFIKLIKQMNENLAKKQKH